MQIVVGYRWFETSAGYHIERALTSLGHTVTYAGLSTPSRAGYNHEVDLNSIITTLPQPPDFFLWIDPAGRYFPPGIEDCPVPTACYLIDVHLGHWRQQAARFFDAVFVAQRDYVTEYQAAVKHDQVYWLPLAAAPDVHYQHDLRRDYDVGFVGNITRAHRATARARRLQLITQRFKTNDVYRPYTPEEVGLTYSQSKIVFNTSIAGDVTMRLFEGTACGALVLTDSIANGLEQLFEIGKEIVVYQDDDALAEKIAYYLAHDDERDRIARAGQKRTLKQHLFTHRVQQIVDTITASSFQRIALMRTADQATRIKARLDVYTHLHMLDAVFDETRAAGYHPIRRTWAALPCLMRRIML